MIFLTFSRPIQDKNWRGISLKKNTYFARVTVGFYYDKKKLGKVNPVIDVPDYLDQNLSQIYFLY